MFNPSYDTLPAGSYQTFVSRPDLHPPLINVNGSGTPGLIFFDQIGEDVHQPSLIISDHNGDIVYMNDSFKIGANFDVSSIGGRNYLTAWNGTMGLTHGTGIHYMLDDTLNIAGNITAKLGRNVDVHEFRVVNETALVSFYYPLAMNLTKWGGPANGSYT